MHCASTWQYSVSFGRYKKGSRQNDFMFNKKEKSLHSIISPLTIEVLYILYKMCVCVHVCVCVRVCVCVCMIYYFVTTGDQCWKVCRHMPWDWWTTEVLSRSVSWRTTWMNVTHTHVPYEVLPVFLELACQKLGMPNSQHSASERNTSSSIDWLHT